MTTEFKFTSDITVKLVQSMGDDATLAAAAKVLLPEVYQQFLLTHEKNSVAGLLRYLIQHRHGTPFEHSAMTFFVHAPICVWREWHRHRIGFAYSDYGLDDGGLGQSFNEESGRYKQLDPVFYVPPRDRPMFKVEGWKPGRPKFTVMDTAKFEDLKYYKLTDNLKDVYTLSYEKYEENLALGIDPGLARDCLPVGIYSSCWVTCNPRSLMAFLSLRTHDEKAQFVSYPLYEIEVAARAVEEVFKQGWPVTHAAFNEFGRTAP